MKSLFRVDISQSEGILFPMDIDVEHSVDEDLDCPSEFIIRFIRNKLDCMGLSNFRIVNVFYCTPFEEIK